MVVYDLMSGMGECWHIVARELHGSGALLGLDISPVMCARSEATRAKLNALPIDIRQEDFLLNSLPSSSADCVISCFGLKTFSIAQLTIAARQIARILKPGASFALLEISVPPGPLLRAPYMFYLKRIIPLIGRILLGNPENYRMLGLYTEHFGGIGQVADLLREQGLMVEERAFFFGCATAVSGNKPSD
jgi:demethylmenaquinone methyltransferase/2-methoxy-6-polyprenyl-1,4-benzoquinol methylase